MPNDPALVPEAYVRECAAVCWMRLADADVTSTRPPEELRAVLHLMATQAVGEGLRAWTLALWGLAHDPINQRSLVRLGAIPVVNARISEVRAMVVETVRSLATKETAASMDMQMSILVRPRTHPSPPAGVVAQAMVAGRASRTHTALPPTAVAHAKRNLHQQQLRPAAHAVPE